MANEKARLDRRAGINSLLYELSDLLKAVSRRACGAVCRVARLFVGVRL